MAIWRYNDAPPDLSGLPTFGDLSALENTINVTSAQWLAYIAAQNAEQSGGISFSRSFEGTGPLPATMYQDSRVGMGVKDSALVPTYGFVSNRDYTFWALDRTPLTTDDFSVVVNIRAYPKAGTPTYILARANADMSEAIYCAVMVNTLVVGKVSFDGPDPTYTPWNTVTGIQIPNNGTVEFRGSGNNYTVKANGVALQNFTSVAAPYPIDSLHRFVGAAFEQDNAFFTSTISSGITSLTASDIAVPATLGTGWDMFRASTSGSAKGSGNSVVSGCYDSLRRSANCVPNLGDGYVGITRPGWYTLSLRFQFTASAGTSVYCPLIYGNVTGGSTPTVLRAGQDITGTQINNSMGTFEIYLPAGSFVMPGANTPNTRTIVGDPTGYITYWTGALSRTV